MISSNSYLVILLLFQDKIDINWSALFKLHLRSACFLPIRATSFLLTSGFYSLWIILPPFPVVCSCFGSHCPRCDIWPTLFDFYTITKITSKQIKKNKTSLYNWSHYKSRKISYGCFHKNTKPYILNIENSFKVH